VAANKKIFIGPGEGAYLPVLDITHKVTAENFGGAFTIIEVGLAPGEMIPPHAHAREDECAYVLEGELTFDVGGEVMVASAGALAVGLWVPLMSLALDPAGFDLASVLALVFATVGAYAGALVGRLLTESDPVR
jgi:Cupin domain